MKNKDFKISFKHFLLYTGISFVVLFLVSFSILIITERRVRILKFEETQSREMSAVNLGTELIGTELSSAVADLEFLTYVYKMHYHLEEGVTNLCQSWAEFSVLNGIYDQIRFIDTDGNEVIRINYSNGSSNIVPEGQLQNKSDRYYFKETIALGDGCVYVSPLDLNIENGVVEVPYKPMIRFCMPVYVDGDLKGIIVLNYLAEGLLDKFREIAKHSERNMILLNSDGYWLSCQDITREWNFMFEDKAEDTFGSTYPDEWAAVLEGNGQQLTDNGLFTYMSVDIAQKVYIKERLKNCSVFTGSGNWYVVSYVLEEDESHLLYYHDIFKLIKEELKENFSMAIILIIIANAFGALLYLYLRSYLKIKYYSEYDGLTGVFNRHSATKKLDEMLAAKERRNFTLSLCFIDVNGLKQVNDVLGHKMGDELLVTVTDVIKSHIREADFVARMGGDEFIIAFSRAGVDVAEAVWQRIIKSFDKINKTENRDYIISVSHGVVTCDKEHNVQRLIG